MNKLHITRRQWISFFKWALYTLLFLFAIVLQTTILGRVTLFGAKFNLVPSCIVCIALTEGSERGGVFALLASLIWTLTGGDFGFVSIVVLTAAAVFSAWLCSAYLFNTLLPCAILCLLTLLVHESLIFLLRLYLGRVVPMQYVMTLLPGVIISLIGCPLFFALTRSIHKTGGAYGT